MNTKYEHRGSVMLITVFVIAFLSAVVIGMLQMITEEIQVMHNQVCAAEALAIAEAGLNDALAEIRTLDTFDGSYSKSFAGGTYAVDILSNLPNVTIESNGTSPQGYVARVEADATVALSGPPYVIRIDELRINE